MDTKILDGDLFEKAVTGGASALFANTDVVNDLNVFPIPDGDTGDNMALTISGGVNNMKNRQGTSLGEAARELAKGMLMSARGNSGVILSQLFAGIADGFDKLITADIPAIAAALKKGVERAYSAVLRPTEGTILTVARESVDYACSRITEDSTLETFSEDCVREMHASLERTPELLDVLKEAGVIDSGGAGLYYIAEGVGRVIHGEEVEDVQSHAVAAPAALDLGKFTSESVMEFGYCTEFLLRLQRSKTDPENFDIAPVIDFLNTQGDSIVAVKEDTILKIHVHTMEPEKVLAYMHQYGEFLTLKIENMTLQHHETTIENRFEKADKPVAERKPFGVVTVATGSGIKEALYGLGADVILDGGQGKNPSTEDFIHAYEDAMADVIFVLPNNGNIVMAAKQAAELFFTADVRVIESKNLGEGYAALTMLSYDSGDPDVIAQELLEAMQGVTTGMVTRSVRSAVIDGVEIEDGHYIGFMDHKMLASEETGLTTACAVLEKLNVAEHEFVIVAYGKDCPPEDREGLRAYMAANHPRTELFELDGGQEVYDFLLILE